MPRPTVDGILTASARTFSERGYGNTPLRDLIAACGCSTTAFYARFASKEAVLEALIQRLLERLHSAALEALPKARSVEEGYALGIDVLCSQLRGNKGIWRLALTDGAHQKQTRPMVRDAYTTLASLLAAQLDGVTNDAEARAWAIVGTLSMHLTRWAVFEELTATELERALRESATLLLPAKR